MTRMAGLTVNGCHHVALSGAYQSRAILSARSHRLGILNDAASLNDVICHYLGFLPNTFLKAFVVGTIATLANQGVAHTLKTNRNGSSAFVTA